MRRSLPSFSARLVPALLPGVLRPLTWAAVCLCLLCSVLPAQVSSLKGLPFTRAYPLEEIGNVPKGSRLGFDVSGRLTLTQDNFHVALNDTTWVDLLDRGPNNLVMAYILQASQEDSYFGSRGLWGRILHSADGRLKASSLVPENRPDWTRLTLFTDMVATDTAVYFGGRYGVVRWEKSTGRHSYLELSNYYKTFLAGGRVYVSTYDQPLLRLELEDGALKAVSMPLIQGSAIDHATSLDDKRTLLALRNGELLVFDGHSVTPWLWKNAGKPKGGIAALQRLMDGGIAIAMTGGGLFLVAKDGTPMLSLTTPQYHRITGLACREPGVLWLITEEAVEKVLYGSPLTAFGQRLGLTAYWPLVLNMDDRIIVSSSGVLYQSVRGMEGLPSRFEQLPLQVPKGAWCVAARGNQLLVGNTIGVFEYTLNAEPRQILAIKDITALAMQGPDVCLVVGKGETTALRWSEGRWSECAKRIQGLDAANIHPTGDALWVELGINRVARLSLEPQGLRLKLIDLPWPSNQWSNIGFAGNRVIVSGAQGERLFFDAKTGDPCEDKPLASLLERSPYWITRVMEDDQGRLWASHLHGVVLYTPGEADYTLDYLSCNLNNDYYPFVRVLRGNDVWLSTSRTLFHVDVSRLTPPRRPTKPGLVSLFDERSGRELRGLVREGQPPPRFPFGGNTLSFTFFSGTYAYQRSPEFEYRLGGAQRWSRLETGKALRFAEFGEGEYRLETRLLGSAATPEATASIDFIILPPWHRTWQAYALAALLLVTGVLVLVRWAVRHSHRKNLALERLVGERTAQLARTMEQLNEETRNTATLAERTRLGGEIHDSIQQGIIGTLMQLDATLKLPSVPAELRSRLDMARAMLSFTRHELQHAIWDLESPLLENSELDDALRKLMALMNPGGVVMNIATSGLPRPLPQATKHHLLRIAQEAVTNTVRHAKASELQVALHYGTDTLRLQISDNGVGFNLEAVSPGGFRHFGVRGMRSRAQKLQGTLTLQSSPGKGTSLQLSIPLPPLNAPASDANTRQV